VDIMRTYGEKLGYVYSRFDIFLTTLLNWKQMVVKGFVDQSLAESS